MSPKEAARKNILESIAALKEQLKQVEQIPDISNAIRWTIAGTPDCQVPYSLAALRQARRELGPDYRFYSQWSGVFSHNGFPFYCARYKNDSTGDHVILSMNGDNAGPNCRIEIVGEKIVQIKKVICE